MEHPSSNKKPRHKTSVSSFDAGYSPLAKIFALCVWKASFPTFEGDMRTSALALQVPCPKMEHPPSNKKPRHKTSVNIHFAGFSCFARIFARLPLTSKLDALCAANADQRIF